jgi:hypothetical protein
VCYDKWREKQFLIGIGLDPPGFKLRAASGFEAADFFVAGMIPTVWISLILIQATGYGIKYIAHCPS